MFISCCDSRFKFDPQFGYFSPLLRKLCGYLVVIPRYSSQWNFKKCFWTIKSDVLASFQSGLKLPQCTDQGHLASPSLAQFPHHQASGRVLPYVLLVCVSVWGRGKEVSAGSKLYNRADLKYENDSHAPITSINDKRLPDNTWRSERPF